MHSLSLIVFLTASAATASPPTVSATPAAYTTYRAYHPYTPYRPYRPPYHRPPPSYRERLFADNYLGRPGLTFEIHGGFHDLLAPPGAYGTLRSHGGMGYSLGYDISPFVHWGLGVDAYFYGMRDARLGDVKSVGQLTVTTDVTIRLLRPSDRRYVVPFLQAGLGVALITGSQPQTTVTTDCNGNATTTQSSKSVTLARGGIFQVGGGVEFYLTRYLALRLRALYRIQPMSDLRCVAGPDATCPETPGRNQVTLQGYYTDLSLQVHFWSI